MRLDDRMKTLYNKKYVYFDWDDKLESKECFVADYIDNLKWNVNNNSDPEQITHNKDNDSYPFREKDTEREWCFAYYDPNYAVKKALLEGKDVQYYRNEFDKWTNLHLTCNVEDYLDSEDWDIYEYRIKPNEMFYAEYFDNHIVKSYHPIPENVLFQSEREKKVDLFIDDGEYLEEIIKAAREGKTIQFKEFGVSNDPWKESTGWDDLSQHDFVHYEYRIDECTECLKHNMCDTPGKRCESYCTKAHVPFDTVQELITHWEGMNPGCTNRPKCAMPMIWVKENRTNCIHLITGYDENDKYSVMVNDIWISLKDLFDYYRFINDSIIGKRR